MRSSFSTCGINPIASWSYTCRLAPSRLYKAIGVNKKKQNKTEQKKQGIDNSISTDIAELPAPQVLKLYITRTNKDFCPIC